VIQSMVDDGQRIFGFDLQGDFFNINRGEDLEAAESALRQQTATLNLAV
jgi:NDP-sugar pyrophosphorylase family protein